MSGQGVEATAPCRVDLAGKAWPGLHAVHVREPGAVAVSVAIDRRAWCRIETGVDGVHLESKDTLQKVSGASVAELLERGGASPVAHVLSVLGFESGVRVVTQRRVPADSGLGGQAAVAVAVAGAAGAAAGRTIDPEGLWPILRDAEARSRLAGSPPCNYQPALRGGVLAVGLEPGEPRVAALPVDPGRVEESLLLVDGGEGAASETSGEESLEERIDRDEGLKESLAILTSLGQRVETALVEGRFEDVVDLLAEEWEARERLWPGLGTPEVERIREVVRGAGGAARVCGGGRGRVVAVWAPPGDRGPGRREAVEGALSGAGVRVFPARVDLRGLEVG
jgi:galactokinase/mevalonate kinase-like predicted kinase